MKVKLRKNATIMGEKYVEGKEYDVDQGIARSEAMVLAYAQKKGSDTK